MKNKRSVPLILLLILAIEKSIQHMYVTYAFINNLGGIRKSVSFDYRFFMISGFLAGILFLISFVLIMARKPLGIILLFYLALFDFIGEFVAQGKLSININVSIIVASIIIVIIWRRRDQLISELEIKSGTMTDTHAA